MKQMAGKPLHHKNPSVSAFEVENDLEKVTPNEIGILYLREGLKPTVTS